MRASVRRGVLIGAVVLTFSLSWLVAPISSTQAFAVPVQGIADFGNEPVSAEVQNLANWAIATDDNKARDFFIIDKPHARLYVLDAAGRLRASTPVLIGSALGDISAPGIGQRAIDHVTPAERVTPAGRFMAERGRNLRGEDVVWVDYDAAVSIHRVINTNPLERRLERLDSPSPDDNRITYGCINVAPAFYEAYIRPAFASHRAVVYVVPDTGSGLGQMTAGVNPSMEMRRSSGSF